MFKGKISVIGTGFVGSTTAYTLMLSGLVSELVLIDMDGDRAEGHALDMNHGISFVSPMQISGGADYSMIRDSDMVIIAAGANQKQGESRVDLLRRNAAVFKDIIDNILKYCGGDTIFMVVTNPVDILTYVTWKLSGADKRKVIGSGTVLDTARLKYLIGEHVNVDPRNIHTFIVGEHGDSEVPLWSLSTVAGMSFDDYCHVCRGCDTGSLCKDEFYNRTRNAAYEIIEKKGATYYAIGLAVRRIVESIIGNEHSILTVSSLLEGEYGLKDVCLSVPSIVNKNGVDRILELPLPEDERGMLNGSAEMLKDLIRQIGL